LNAAAPVAIIGLERVDDGGQLFTIATQCRVEVSHLLG
jgi:hypothetical protein